MKFIWKHIRPYIKDFYKFYKLFIGFTYDFKRFVLYSGWRNNMKDAEQRNYFSVLVYHALEKSMSYKNRNADSGWKNAYKLLDLLKIANKYNNVGYHDKAAKQVLETFINLPENREHEKSKQIKQELKTIQFNSTDKHGAIKLNQKEYQQGILENPEAFFFSRYSLREFKDAIVPNEIISRAVKLAMKTPSVCNRQPWHIYHTNNKCVKDTILKYQSGNKPFGEKIPNLMIISIDLKAFFLAEEHYEYWIDGGMFSMSLIYAFHALGIATCPLNWSTPPSQDRLLRKEVDICPHHTIVMLLAIGYPDASNITCASARRPLDEIYTQIRER